jgi:hypothetical protein
VLQTRCTAHYFLMVAHAPVTRHTCTTSVYVLCVLRLHSFRKNTSVRHPKYHAGNSLSHAKALTQISSLKCCVQTNHVIHRSKHKHIHPHKHTHTHNVNRPVYTCLSARVRKREIPADTNKFPFEARSFSVRMKNTYRLPSATYDSVLIEFHITYTHYTVAMQEACRLLRLFFPVFPPNSSLFLTYSPFMR